MIDRVADTIQGLEHNLYARLALASGIATLAISTLAQARTPNATPHISEPLEQISQLPGYHIGVSAAAELALQKSAVVVENDSRGAYNLLSPSNICSGNVVSFNRHEYVSLDAHCEGEITGATLGLIWPNWVPGGQEGALDFIKSSYMESFVDDTNTTGLETKIGRVTGMDVSTEGVDSALLRIKPVKPHEDKTGIVPPAFNNLAALPYLETPTLVPGQEVALYASPSSSPRPVAEVGRYMGMDKLDYKDNGKKITVTDYAVVTYPRTKARDAGYFGASGAKFAAMATKNGSTTGMHGKVVFSTGGESNRYSLDDVGDPNSNFFTKKQEMSRIKQIERNTGVEVGKKAVILLFSDPSLADRQDLASDFNQYIKG
jgi:hypothetical protein